MTPRIRTYPSMKNPAYSTSTQFDIHGRLIPSALTHPANPESRRYFRIEQPGIDYPAIFNRIKKHLGPPLSLTHEQFEQRAQGILTRLQETPWAENITRGAHVPFFLPRSERIGDLGDSLEKTYLPAVESSFSESFSQYQFSNHHQTGLSGKLSVHPDSRHQSLLDAMHEQDVVGYYFPCLTEYAVPAAQEQISALPDMFHLAGGHDTCAALVGSPGLLQRQKGYSNMLWLAALQAEKETAGYYFESYGLNLTFNRRVHFGTTSEYWASALVVLG